MSSTIFPSASAKALLALCLLLASAGCRADGAGADPRPDGTGQATVVETGARRADPGYIQYLEKLSMLGSQTELARIVSGSQLAWLRPAARPAPETLLRLADSWLAVDPHTMLPETKKSVFATLASPVYWQIITKSRFGGLYLAPASGAGALWAYNRKASARGDDTIQYAFAEAAGSENDYFTLLDAANNNKKLLGLELTPAATGLGPDFFLAARYHRQFSGLYAMVDLPPQVWPELPAVSDQWRGEALSREQTDALAAKKLLPPAMAQDFFPTGRDGGWAVTGEIHGVDGLARRWAYRYHGSPDRPLLHWEDPSAGARAILSGSAIRSVGMLGGALVGMRMDGLYGLDAAAPGGETRFAAAPGDEAARAVSREVRRYGGWSWLKDALPLSAVAALMPDGPDFFRDTVFSPGIEHAVLTGSTAVLDAMVDDALFLGLDMRRFVHATGAEEGVSYLLPHFAAVAAGGGTGSALRPGQADTLRQEAVGHAQQAVYGGNLASPRGNDKPSLREKTLNTTTAGVAALALGKGNTDSVTKEDLPVLRDGHFLQIFIRAMLPGLFMLSGQDLAASLPVSWYAMSANSEEWDPALASRGAYAFTRSIPDTAATSQGMPRAQSLHPTADVQITDEASFAARLAGVLAVRTLYGVAGGALRGRFVTSVPGCFAYAVVLPPNGAQPGNGAPLSAPAQTAPSAVREKTGEIRESVRALPLAKRREREREETERRRNALKHRIITAPVQEAPGRRGDAALVAAFNFSRDTVREALRLSDPVLRALREKGAPVLLAQEKETAEGGVRMDFDDATITFTLPPWRGAVVHIGKR